MVTRPLEGWKSLRSGLRLLLLLGPLAAAAQGLGPGEAGSGDGSEGIAIDAVFCLGLPLLLFGSLFLWIRFVVQGAKRAANSRARRNGGRERE